MWPGKTDKQDRKIGEPLFLQVVKDDGGAIVEIKTIPTKLQQWRTYQLGKIGGLSVVQWTKNPVYLETSNFNPQVFFVGGHHERWEKEFARVKASAEDPEDSIAKFKKDGGTPSLETRRLCKLMFISDQYFEARQVEKALPPCLRLSPAESYWKSNLKTTITTLKSEVNRNIYTPELIQWVCQVATSEEFIHDINDAARRRMHFLKQAGRDGIAGFWMQVLGEVLDVPWIFNRSLLSDQEKEGRRKAMRNRLALLMSFICDNILVFRLNDIPGDDRNDDRACTAAFDCAWEMGGMDNVVHKVTWDEWPLKKAFADRRKSEKKPTAFQRAEVTTT